MPSNSPLFSIVIPTRNRAHLLPHALRSALEQELDDYEIVVVANNCQDRTRDVVRELQQPRIRYVETDRTLTMPDNWDFAWTHARGQYVLYLPDDDALVPSALRRLAERTLDGEPAIVSWEDAPYYYPDWHDRRMQNLLLLFFHGDVEVEDVPSSVYRDQCAQFSFEWSSPLPKLLNCAANRSALELWRSRLGRLFFPIAPDYSFAWIVSHVFPTIRVLHRPLTVRGISDHSIGSNAGLGPATQEFFREFGSFDRFAEAPLQLPVSMTYLAATFQRVSGPLRKHGVVTEQLDLGRFLAVAAQQLVEGRPLIAGWDEHAATVRGAARAVSAELSQTVDAILAAPAPLETAGESIRQVRRRTARMALEYPPNVANVASEHQGDEQCARCTLGLEEGVLAGQGWDCLYVFGEEIDAFDPRAIGQRVDEYYHLLTECRRKRRQSATARE